MGWCNVGADDGAKAVADLLMFNSTLVTLDLRGNGLGDAGKCSVYTVGQRSPMGLEPALIMRIHIPWDGSVWM